MAAVFIYLNLFWDTNLNIPIHNTDRICGNVYNCWHLHGLTISQVKFRTMAWTDNIVSLNGTISQRPIIMRTDIANGKQLARNIKDDNRFIGNVHKKTLATGKF